MDFCLSFHTLCQTDKEDHYVRTWTEQKIKQESSSEQEESLHDLSAPPQSDFKKYTFTTYNMRTKGKLTLISAFPSHSSLPSQLLKRNLLRYHWEAEDWTDLLVTSSENLIDNYLSFAHTLHFELPVQNLSTHIICITGSQWISK